jgi:hypothetical protein
MYRLYFILVALSSMSGYPTKDRRPSPPYISGDGFRAHCDFVFDKLSKKIGVTKIKEGDAIFVQPECLPRFFRRKHPKISVRYILVTHNSDFPVPGGFEAYLDDPKILAWFGQNVEGFVHPKLHPLPIGLENRCWSNGNPRAIDKKKRLLSTFAKLRLLYNNFTLATRIAERGKVYEIFKDKAFCHQGARKPFDDYLVDLAESKFVLSPRGNGLDCHRTWESLYMGAIPIVKSSASDSLFEGLPVLIISDWNEVTEELLHEKYEEIRARSVQGEKLTLDYWLRQIDAARNKKGDL